MLVPRKQCILLSHRYIFSGQHQKLQLFCVLEEEWKLDRKCFGPENSPQCSSPQTEPPISSESTARIVRIAATNW